MIAVAPRIQAVETGAGQLSSDLPKGGKRFTLDGSDELEERLGRLCAQVVSGVRRLIPEQKLEGLLLGGGYGRGEGGVFRTENGDQPYNDLEFYVFLRGNNFLNEHRYHAALHGLGRQLSSVAGAEVEFKVLSLGKLRRSPGSMFYYDLVLGHRRLWGRENLLAAVEHHRDEQRIPLSEATRLLMNRCSGLLFAWDRLQRETFSSDDADFVERNLAKAQLAYGDAVLTVFGRYHWSCRERHRRLKCLEAPEDLASLPEVRTHHASGVEFKLRPWRSTASRFALRERHRKLASLGLELWLWLEKRRLNHPFGSPEDYAGSSIDKCPETGRWRNRALNLLAFGLSALLDSRGTRYPRERVLHALVWLLWRRQETDESDLVRRIGRELRVPVRSFSEAVTAYTSLWRQFR